MLTLHPAVFKYESLDVFQNGNHCNRNYSYICSSAKSKIRFFVSFLVGSDSLLQMLTTKCPCDLTSVVFHIRCTGIISCVSSALQAHSSLPSLTSYFILSLNITPPLSLLLLPFCSLVTLAWHNEANTPKVRSPCLFFFLPLSFCFYLVLFSLFSFFLWTHCCSWQPTKAAEKGQTTVFERGFLKASAGALICLIPPNNTGACRCLRSLPQRATQPVIIPRLLSLLLFHLVSPPLFLSRSFSRPEGSFSLF